MSVSVQSHIKRIKRVMSLDKHTVTLRGAKSISHREVTSESDSEGVDRVGGLQMVRKVKMD